MKFVAVDLETVLFEDRKSFQLKQTNVYTEPFKIPAPVLMTVSWDGKDADVIPASMIKQWFTNLHSEMHLVFHNAQFDIGVLAQFDPELGAYLWNLAGQGMVHDTMIMDWLFRLKSGRFDIPTYPDFNLENPQMRPLDDVAAEYASMVLIKDPAIRLNFHLYKDCLERLPTNFREYAKQDAIATYRVWEEQLSRLTEQEKVKLLSEPLQTKASLAFAKLDQWGVHIDTNEARRLRRFFEKDLPGLEQELVKLGLGRWEPDSRSIVEEEESAAPENAPREWTLDGDRIVKWRVFKNKAKRSTSTQFHFCLNQNVLRERLKKVEVDEPYPTSDSGMLSLDAEWWAGKIPLMSDLRTWLDRAKLVKVLTTYLYLYSSVPHVYPRWHVLGARSGRTSCSSPNIQNVPKRKYGIRSLVIPQPGNVLVVADYSTQELLTLAEYMSQHGIEGPLLEAIKGGKDLHRFTAALLNNKPEEAVTKEERQAAKAINFGVPGGLGPKKLADYAAKEYHVNWTLEEARGVMKKYLKKFPDIRAFLDAHRTSLNANLLRVSGRGVRHWMEELGLDPDNTTLPVLKWSMITHPSPAIRRLIIQAERNLTVLLPSGRVRHGATFTEGANTAFQGLASDVSKLALFNAVHVGLRPILFVHDEIVVECSPEQATEHAKCLEWCMLGAFMEVCPTVGRYAKVELTYPLGKWGAAKDKEGHDL